MRDVSGHGFLLLGEEALPRQGVPISLKQRQEHHRAKDGGHARGREPRRCDDETARKCAIRQSEQSQEENSR